MFTPVLIAVNNDFVFSFQGAPETIQGRLTEVPLFYVETYKKFTRQGSRVLALAYKSLPDMTVRFLDLLFLNYFG